MHHLAEGGESLVVEERVVVVVDEHLDHQVWNMQKSPQKAREQGAVQIQTKGGKHLSCSRVRACSGEGDVAGLVAFNYFVVADVRI